MIQRIQTIFLLVATTLLIITAFIWNGVFADAGGQTVETVSKIAKLLVIVASLLSALISVVAIFLYGNRKRQIGIVRCAIAPIAIMYIALAWMLFSSEATLISAEFWYLPLVSVVFIILAINRIQADEKLVRSMDRIR